MSNGIFSINPDERAKACADLLAALDKAEAMMAIERTEHENDVATIADLHRQLAAMKPVVEAAEGWDWIDESVTRVALRGAVDAYSASAPTG